jgi:hypothetical protein
LVGWAWAVAIEILPEPFHGVLYRPGFWRLISNRLIECSFPLGFRRRLAGTGRRHFFFSHRLLSLRDGCMVGGSNNRSCPYQIYTMPPQKVRGRLCFGFRPLHGSALWGKEERQRDARRRPSLLLLLEWGMTGKGRGPVRTRLSFFLESPGISASVSTLFKFTGGKRGRTGNRPNTSKG